MKFYLASRFEDRERMRAARRNLIDLGHTVQAQWIDLEPDVLASDVRFDHNKAALRDLSDVTEGDALILFDDFEDPTPPGRGGRYIEFGYALALGKRVFYVGNKERNIFFGLRSIERAAPTWSELRNHFFIHRAHIESGERKGVLVIPMLLECPKCHTPHIDEPDLKSGWMNPPHRTHLCHKCGTKWRPSDFHTTGVVAIGSRGKDDTWTR